MMERLILMSNGVSCGIFTHAKPYIYIMLNSECDFIRVTCGDYENNHLLRYVPSAYKPYAFKVLRFRNTHSSKPYCVKHLYSNSSESCRTRTNWQTMRSSKLEWNWCGATSDDGESSLLLCPFGRRIVYISDCIFLDEDIAGMVNKKDPLSTRLILNFSPPQCPNDLKHLVKDIFSPPNNFQKIKDKYYHSIVYSDCDDTGSESSNSCPHYQSSEYSFQNIHQTRIQTNILHSTCPSGYNQSHIALEQFSHLSPEMTLLTSIDYFPACCLAMVESIDGIVYKCIGFTSSSNRSLVDEGNENNNDNIVISLPIRQMLHTIENQDNTMIETHDSNLEFETWFQRDTVEYEDVKFLDNVCDGANGIQTEDEGHDNCKDENDDLKWIQSSVISLHGNLVRLQYLEKTRLTCTSNANEYTPSKVDISGDRISNSTSTSTTTANTESSSYTASCKSNIHNNAPSFLMKDVTAHISLFEHSQDITLTPPVSNHTNKTRGTDDVSTISNGTMPGKSSTSTSSSKSSDLFDLYSYRRHVVHMLTFRQHVLQHKQKYTHSSPASCAVTQGNTIVCQFQLIPAYVSTPMGLLCNSVPATLHTIATPGPLSAYGDRLGLSYPHGLGDQAGMRYGTLYNQDCMGRSRMPPPTHPRLGCGPV